MGTTEALLDGWEDTTPSGDTLTLAALRAMADRAARWASAAGGRVRAESGLVLADAGSPCPFLNVAAATRPVDAAMAAAAAEFFGGAFMLVTPRPTPDLRPSGLALMGHPPFMVRPAGGVAPHWPSGVTVTELDDAAELAAFDRTLADGFPVQVSPTPPSLLGSATRFWLARADGEPAATAVSHTAHGVTDVEAVATLPDHRGRGIGAAVTWAATLADPAQPAVLIASDDGVGVYRAMGYLAVTRWTIWFRA
jgi:hypothetical protein